MVDLNKIQNKIITGIKKRFPGANVEPEYGGPMKITLNIIWDKFGDIPESERQDMIWEYLIDNYKYSDIKFIGFIMTWTSEELKFYEQEYGNSIAETALSK